MFLRRQVKRPELVPADRLILTALGLSSPPGRLLFSAATLLRWHRKLMRKHWSAFGLLPRPGRPPISDELQQLIQRLAVRIPAGASAASKANCSIRLPGIGDHHPRHPSHSASTQARWSDLGRVPQRPRRSHPGLRLRHRRHRAASDSLRCRRAKVDPAALGATEVVGRDGLGPFTPAVTGPERCAY